MKESELYDLFVALYHCNDFGESDNGVDKVVDALFATHTVVELTEMYEKLKDHKEHLEQPAKPEFVLTNISLIDGDITKEMIENMEPNTMFAHGLVSNSQEGIYMSSSNVGRVLKWCAVRRGAPDWTVYVLWDDEHDYGYVRSNGDTVNNMDNVKKLLSCTDGALKMYAH